MNWFTASCWFWNIRHFLWFFFWRLRLFSRWWWWIFFLWWNRCRWIFFLWLWSWRRCLYNYRLCWLRHILLINNNMHLKWYNRSIPILNHLLHNHVSFILLSSCLISILMLLRLLLKSSKGDQIKCAPNNIAEKLIIGLD